MALPLVMRGSRLFSRHRRRRGRVGERRRSLQYEPLEKRCLLDGSPLDPHEMFPGEVFLADSEILQSVDFDGDTVPDLIGLRTQLSIPLGRGDGTFQPRTRLDIGNVLGGLSVTDLDGDSSPDIAVTNAQRNPIRVTRVRRRSGSAYRLVARWYEAVVSVAGNEHLTVPTSIRDCSPSDCPARFRVLIGGLKTN